MYLNDGGVFNHVYNDIYSPELQLKVEHSGTHTTFLNLDANVKDGVFVYKLLISVMLFLFFIVRMPYIDSNIPKSIFYSALVAEFLRIARSSLLYKDFHEKTMELLNSMKAQGTLCFRCKKALSKIIQRHEKAIANFGKIVMKFFLNFIFKLNTIYYLTHDTLSTVLPFCYIYF